MTGWTSFVAFLVQQEIIPDKPYLKAALEPQRGHFAPEDKRIFFTRVTHREPMLLYSHGLSLDRSFADAG